MVIFDEVKFLFWPDIDECAILASLPNPQNDTKLRSCHEKATCMNAVGSYRCECIRGYAGDGFTCIGSIYLIAIMILNGYIKEKN